MSQESSRRASARRKDFTQPKDLGWLDPCDKHRDEGEVGVPENSRLRTCSPLLNLCAVHYDLL
ncbi:MAG: hypothetical protein DI595_02585 [Agrobacterium fabrum]|uniref:Uncharacterized protein n=1 Tax=Agrobacterium fabrum TaxID=1176649 RepID=A0A2W5FE99_9HYPH|nr:MAG: hypothetical protein DI595_02585 [Agrobacterium fabrum]